MAEENESLHGSKYTFEHAALKILPTLDFPSSTTLPSLKPRPNEQSSTSTTSHFDMTALPQHEEKATGKKEESSKEEYNTRDTYDPESTPTFCKGPTLQVSIENIAAEHQINQDIRQRPRRRLEYSSCMIAKPESGVLHWPSLRIERM